MREQLVDHHLDYLKKKLQAYKRGEGTHHHRCINIHAPVQLKRLFSMLWCVSITKGEALDTRDEFWAVHRVALQVVGHPFTEIHKLDTRQIR